MISLSQTAVKEYYSMDSKCGLKWHFENVQGIRKDPSEVMIKGQIFEDVLIGSTRDGNKPSLPLVGVRNLKPTKTATKAEKILYLSKKGIPAYSTDSSDLLDAKIFNLPADYSEGSKPSAQIEVEQLAERSKEYLPALGIEILRVQPELRYREGDLELIGHPDLEANVKGRRAFVDIKYTETAEDDRWNGWGDPESKPWTDLLQSVFYPFIEYQWSGEIVDFYYLIFGKSGWIKWIRIQYDPEVEFSNLEQRIASMVEEIRTIKPTPTDDFNVCNTCHLKEAGTCDQYARIPKLENVTI